MDSPQATCQNGRELNNSAAPSAGFHLLEKCQARAHGDQGNSLAGNAGAKDKESQRHRTGQNGPSCHQDTEDHFQQKSQTKERG